MLTFIRSAQDSRKAWYRCECGEEFVAFRSNAASGHTQSCGCLQRRVTGDRRRTHGQRSGILQQGKRPRGYAAWVNMRQRCTNQKRNDFTNYGQRGIRVCERWDKYEHFLADMGEPAKGMTLDRIDNMADYTPENCRWVPRSVQALNKRNCVRYEYNGQSKTLAEWSRETGIGRVTMLKRLQRGWSIARALTEAPAY